MTKGEYKVKAEFEYKGEAIFSISDIIFDYEFSIENNQIG